MNIRNESIVQYLWYIIPGTIVLLPFIGAKYGSELKSYQFLFITFAFVVGFILHQIYRIIEDPIFRANTQKNNYIIEILHDIYNKKKISHKTSKNIYTYFIRGLKDVDFSYVDKRSVYMSSIGTTIIALFIGGSLVKGLIFPFLLRNNIGFYTCLFLILVLVASFLILKQDRDRYVEFLIDRELKDRIEKDEEFKTKLEKIIEESLE